MFKALCRSRFQAYTASFLRADRKGKMRSKGSLIGYGLLFAYAGICFLFLFYMMAAQLAAPLTGAGLGWLYFALFGVMATILGVVGSVFTTQVQMFEAKDNELLLSMPIPPAYILGSRLIALYIQTLLVELVVLLPALAGYLMEVGMGAAGVILYLLIALTLPILALALSCVLGWAVALVSSRMRSKTLMTMLLSVGLMGGYFFLFSRMNTYLQQLIANGEAVARTVRRVLFPFYQMGLAAEGNFLSFGLYLLCVLLPFAAVYAVISASFLKIATHKRGAARIRYQEKKLAVSSPARALFRKEAQHLFASPMYMLNGAQGSVFLLVGAVALLVKSDALLSFFDVIPGFEAMLPALLILSIGAVSSMNLITAPSVSLEGRTLWIVRCFPVSGWAVLRSKLQLHLAVTSLPGLLCSLACLAVLPMDPAEMALMLVMPQLFSLLCALLGLVINLHFPRFDWTSEAVVLKRGMSVMLSLFVGWGVILTIWLGYLPLRRVLPLNGYLALATAVLALGCGVAHRWLKTRGSRIFETFC